MDFESVYKKYSDGNATDEERAFVEQELEKARKMTEIIDHYESVHSTSEKSDSELVKKAQKRYAKKSVLRVLVICCTVLVIATAIVLASVFGVAFGSANKNINYSQTNAEQIALDYVIKNFGYQTTKPVIASSEKEIQYSSNLKDSVYVYDVKIYVGYVNELEITVSAKTGKVIDMEISTI